MRRALAAFLRAASRATWPGICAGVVLLGINDSLQALADRVEGR